MVQSRTGTMSGRRCFLVAGAVILCGKPLPACADPDACKLVADDRNPSRQMLRCGDQLTIRSAPETSYRVKRDARENPAKDGLPDGAELQSGALMIELKRTERERSFQILTPHAIAAARGTTWAVQVDSDGTHALVMLGYVEVTPRGARNGVLLRANQGADVPSGADRTTAKRWGKARVDALLARFGMRRSCFFRPTDC